MRKFVYIIGTTDDFESIEDLQNTYRNGMDTPRNMSVYPVWLSEETKVQGYDTLQEIAVMIGRGEAMTNDWCLDDTVSILLEA
jgi:hypothetical protein